MNNSAEVFIKTEDRHNTWAWIPPVGSESPSQPGRASLHTNGTTTGAYDDFDEDYRCLKCRDAQFASEDVFLNHIAKHVEQPTVLLARLSPWYVKKLTSRKPRQSGIAKKRTKSYIAPLSHGHLKLTLKLAADATSKNRSFQVVPKPHVLAGPGEIFTADGYDQVKLEAVEREEAAGSIVEGEGGKLAEEGEGGERAAESDGGEKAVDAPEELSGAAIGEIIGVTLPGVDADENSEEEEDDEEEEEDYDGDEGDSPAHRLLDGEIDIKDNLVESPETGAKLLEEVCRATTNNLLDDDDFSDDGSDFDDAAPSPTPSEQLRPDFLRAAPSPTPSEQVTTDFPPHGISMVEVNGSNGTAEHSSISPAFPSDSPDAPQENNTDGQNGAVATSDASKNAVDPSIFPASGFHWGSPEASEAMGPSPIEEHDPLQLPDNVTGASLQLLSSDALLRGFLSDDKTDTPATTTLGSDAQLSLGSEYISLDRLGEHRCEVCGEKATSREGLDEHRSNAGHYKCNRPECCGKVFPNSEELATHLRSLHASQFPRPPLITVNQSLQSPPVQQLQQQVQRLAMPGPQGYLNQALTTSVPMVQLPGQSLHPSQQPAGFAQDPQRRPPPLYRVPAPVAMAPPPQHLGAGLAPQYANTQHMMTQMYNTQYRQMQPGFHQQINQQQLQQQQQQQQQRPNYMQQMQMRPQQMPPQQQQRMMHPGQQRGQLQGNQIRAKRMAPMGTPQGAPPAKRRPDNDIHVIGMQKRPQPNNVDKRPSLPDSIHLTEAITLSLRQPATSAVTVTPIGAPPKNKSDAKAVANVLASRGITVTPAAGGNNNSNSNNGRPQQQRQSLPPAAVATLNLNSAISIIPTGSGQGGGSGFAVPQNRNRQPQATNVERPPRPPTVDLTGDGPIGGGHNRNSMQHVRGRRGRPPGSSTGGRHQCQICDKAFTTEESLQQHMQLHRSPNKLPYRCNLCTAQYPTQQGLLQHRQVYHKEPASGPELAIPVVDLKQPGVLTRLSNLGIVNYIPLSQLSSPQGGHFGLPIVSVDGARDPAVSNLNTMGASNILSLGPIKQLPR